MTAPNLLTDPVKRAGTVTVYNEPTGRRYVITTAGGRAEGTLAERQHIAEVLDLHDLAADNWRELWAGYDVEVETPHGKGLQPVSCSTATVYTLDWSHAPA